MSAGSPYERALGADVELLHPRLRAYFSRLPPGSVGRGEGVFDVVGTPRRWLWPALWWLAARRVLFPVWERNVPFTVENRADAVGRTLGTRVFRLVGRTRTMVDAVSFGPSGLIDTLGDRGVVRAAFRATVRDGALCLESTRVGLRVVGLRVAVPRTVAPVVRLTERFDDDQGVHRVAVSIEHPLLGRLYEYGGWFGYTIESGES